LGGWITTAAMSLCCLIIVIAYYYQRWKWIQKWAYTTKHGVQCFYEDGAAIYAQADIEKETEIALNKWNTWYRKTYNPVPAWQSLKLAQDIICVFVKEGVFESWTPGYPTRKVYGISSGNWAKVGQGDKPVEQTAYKHEMSHIFLNRIKNQSVQEDEAHQMFREVGV